MAWMPPQGYRTYRTWTCGGCGAYTLAAALETCPHCGTPQAPPAVESPEPQPAASAPPRQAPARKRTRTRTTRASRGG